LLDAITNEVNASLRKLELLQSQFSMNESRGYKFEKEGDKWKRVAITKDDIDDYLSQSFSSVTEALSGYSA
jgi:uncharacterized protein YkuJ